MSAGLDSIVATELANVLAGRLGTELPQTVLFDHPTIGAVASFAAGSIEHTASMEETLQAPSRANQGKWFPTTSAQARVSLA